MADEPAHERVLIHVNDEAVEVRPWALWREAVAAWRVEASAALAHGEGVLIDARGEPVDPGGTVVPGGRITFRRLSDE